MSDDTYIICTAVFATGAIVSAGINHPCLAWRAVWICLALAMISATVGLANG